MAIQTLDLEELERTSNNVYEACLVIARRARDINGDRIAKRKEKEILEESGYDQDLDVYDREFFEGIEHEREINPTVVAQQELMEGKINFRYLSEDEAKFDTMPSE
jgi:DNA-directed RNA polymerase subunit K/omega